MSVRTDDRSSGTIKIMSLLAAMVGSAVVAGLLAAGLFMPVVGAAGATARTGVDFFEALPAELEQSPLAQQSRILAADGSTIAIFYNENRVVVPLSKVAKVMRQAQVAIEDRRFYEHGGIDPTGVVRAAVNNASGDSTQGASTLTQQYVKLTLQENAVYAGDEEGAKAAVDKNIGRKIQEMKYAVALEKKVSKDKILEGYLNIAYFGDGVYGIETAARHYFTTTAAKLTLAQSALLAGIVQQPGTFDPEKKPKAALTRRNLVLSRMLGNRSITKAQHDAAVKTKLSLRLQPTGNGCDSSRYAFFCNYVYQQVLSDQAFGGSPQARRQLVFRGGLTIKTTLDPKLQAKAQKAVLAKVAPSNKSKVVAALSVVQPGTGKVLAMTQSRPYGRNTKKGETTVNYNADRRYGGGGGFPTGSTFKAFTLAAALDDGRPLTSTVNAPPAGYTFQRSEFKPGNCIDLRESSFAVGNSEGNEQGSRNLREITYKSINTAFVRLEGEVGICKVKEVAEKLGVHLGDPTTEYQPDQKSSDKLRPFGTLTLGVEPIAPLTMASAYAAFAADGVYCRPATITDARVLGGKQIKLPKQSCEQALPQNVARAVTVALQDVLTKGTAQGQGIGRPAAGKTGTTNESTQLWFVGYTPQLSTAVWFGHPDASRPMKNIDTGKDYYGGQLYGATVSAPIWRKFMGPASSDLPVQNFGQPDDRTVNGDRVGVPSVIGVPLAQAQQALSSQGFGVTFGQPVASAERAGTVGAQSPESGTPVPRGTTVTLYPSIGFPLPGDGGRRKPGTGRPTGPGPGGGGGNGGGG
jgi:membrane peptidoglycan carboxypeptidase